jgi:hypothetical protein
MMTKLMTWFIELQNRFNELRLFKISMIYVLNQVDDLTSWHDCNVRRAVFSYSMIVIHWAEKYVMKERCTRWEDKVWLYWIILFFSWFDLCHVDVEWIVSIDMQSQSFDVWLWSMKENAFWSFSWALDFSHR